MQPGGRCPEHSPKWNRVSLDGYPVKADGSREGVGGSELALVPTVSLGGSRSRPHLPLWIDLDPGRPPEVQRIPCSFGSGVLNTAFPGHHDDTGRCSLAYGPSDRYLVLTPPASPSRCFPLVILSFYFGRRTRESWSAGL